MTAQCAEGAPPPGRALCRRRPRTGGGPAAACRCCARNAGAARAAACWTMPRQSPYQDCSIQKASLLRSHATGQWGARSQQHSYRGLQAMRHAAQDTQMIIGWHSRGAVQKGAVGTRCVQRSTDSTGSRCRPMQNSHLSRRVSCSNRKSCLEPSYSCTEVMVCSPIRPTTLSKSSSTNLASDPASGSASACAVSTGTRLGCNTTSQSYKASAAEAWQKPQQE